MLKVECRNGFAVIDGIETSIVYEKFLEIQKLAAEYHKTIHHASAFWNNLGI